MTSPKKYISVVRVNVLQTLTSLFPKWNIRFEGLT